MGKYEALPLTALGETSIRLPRKENVPISQAVGVILCGGLGTRMQEITLGKTPKHLLPLTRRSSILENPVITMRQAGIQKLYIVTQSQVYDKMRTYADKNHNLEGIDYIADDYPPKGIIHALRTLITETNLHRPLIKANGDEVFTDLDIGDAYDMHAKSCYPITCLLANDSEGSEKDILWINDRGEVIGLKEYGTRSKNRREYFETGIFIIDPSQFYLLNLCESWREFIEKAIENQVLHGHVYQSTFVNVNTPNDLVKARSKFLAI